MLTRAVPPGSTTGAHAANVFFKPWMIPYGIPTHVLTDNGVQSSKLIATLLVSGFTPSIVYCIHDTWVNHVTATECHQQINGQVERHSSTIVTNQTQALWCRKPTRLE